MHTTWRAPTVGAGSRRFLVELSIKSSALRHWVVASTQECGVVWFRTFD